MLKTITKELEDYFVELQNLVKKSVEITYQLIPWKESLLKSSHEQEVNLILQTNYAENQIQNLLNHLGIQDNTWHDDLYNFDYKFNFESEVEALFREILFTTWNRIIPKIPVSYDLVKETNG